MDIKKLLSSLNAHKVRYVIIGAAAFPVHGYDRATQDIDIFIEPTLVNARRTYEALESIGYDLQTIPTETLLHKKVLLRQYLLDTDIHPFVTGVTFATVWKHRVSARCEGIQTTFASLDDLIRMKQAAGRPKDKEDLRYLKKIRELSKLSTRKQSRRK